MRTFLQFSLKCSGNRKIVFRKEFDNFPDPPQKDDRIPIRKGLSLTVTCRSMQPGSNQLTVICAGRNARKRDEEQHIQEFLDDGWTLQ